jgi:hypothetical protein
VAGPVLAFERAAELLHLDPGLESGRKQLVGGRREHDVDAFLLRDRQVARLVLRIGGEVVRAVELRCVDEEAHHDRVALVAGGAEERDMTGVEGAHRRDEPDRAGSHRCERLVQLLDRANDLHGAVASASTR